MPFGFAQGPVEMTEWLLVGCEGGGAEFADAAVGADDEGQRESVPVLIGVGGVVLLGAGM